MRIPSQSTCEVTHQQRHTPAPYLPVPATIRCGHHQVRRIVGFAFDVFHVLKGEVDVTLRGHQFQAVADGEFVFHRDGGQVAFTLAGKFADKLLAFGDGVTVLVVLVVVVGVATQEAFGIAAMREVFQRFQQGGIERFARGGIVNGLAVDLSGTGAVVDKIWCGLRFSANERPSESDAQRER